jgi:site-specific DNA-methyltransferase (adenine-specific)
MKETPDKFYELAIVDPPYGIDINMNMGRRAGKRKMHDDKKWDDSVPDDIYFAELFRVSKNQIIWGGNYFPLPLTKSWIFWDKEVPDGVSFADGELAWTSFDKTLVKAKIRYTGFQGMENGGKIHPTQKPVALYKWLLKNYAKEGDKILSTHVGSGSDRIAAFDMGFWFEGWEIDPDYHAGQEKRFNQHKSQLTIFKTFP